MIAETRAILRNVIALRLRFSTTAISIRRAFIPAGAIPRQMAETSMTICRWAPAIVFDRTGMIRAAGARQIFVTAKYNRPVAFWFLIRRRFE